MSFHSDLMTNLISDLETALSLSSGDVYEGTEAERVKRTGLSVLIEPVGADNAGKGSGNEDRLHRYNLHVRYRNRKTESGTGGSNASTVKGHLETLVDRYGGTRAITTPSNLIALGATEGPIEEDPDDKLTTVGIVELLAWEAAA